MTAPQAQSISEQNKKLIERWFEQIWNQGRREVIEELFAEDGVFYDGPTTFRGPREFEQFYDRMCSQFSDFQIRPIISLSENDLVCMHWAVTCRHIESSKTVELTGMSVVRIRDGQFVEGWQNWDAARVEAQLSGKSPLSFV